jgi:glutamine---fructose-6-phosphate transaminase (isomerizing)
MCAILGISFLKDATIKDSSKIRLILRNLLVASQDRGGRATGIAVVNGKEINVLKTKGPASQFITDPDYIRFTEDYIDISDKAVREERQTLTILGHCRLDTKGSPDNNDNNHPIVTEDIVGIHNGVISNDDTLFSRFRNKITRRAEVDSEIIFRLINMHVKESKKLSHVTQAIQDTYSMLVGSLACGLVSKVNPYVLHLFKKYSPCDILFFKNIGMVIFSSNLSFINKATKNLDLGNTEVIDFGSTQGIAINLFTRKKYTYFLPEIIV